ncbi:hypothetical protein CP880_05595 [Cutibacterium namnetense]|uniref:Uncharacterized protein n=1 Tax=Cutibacterium namnetense TaxID=1574624 RepID=A0ABX9ICG2_9ACTN|nr:hypothetical protein CP880_05595 [Cutibacterium namnetense]TKW70509.1 MAG: hypothetical protein DI580_11475 [Cutibacterium acnes]
MGPSQPLTPLITTEFRTSSHPIPAETVIPRSHHYHHIDDVKNPGQSSQQNWPGFFTKQLRR